MQSLIKDEVLYRLLDLKQTYVIAVSTGVDSMSLFYYLYKKGYKLVVAHVNHKKRPESENEYRYLKEYCESINVPFEGYELKGEYGSNFQAQARAERYTFFNEVCKKHKADALITAHNSDDVIETILMRITRGSSLRGYRGIEEISYEPCKIIRPLIYTSKEEIYEFAKECNITYFEDSSNKEDHYTRNIIRHKIVPLLKDINPNLKDSFKNFSYDISAAYDFINDEACNFLKTQEPNILVKESFNKLSSSVKNWIIYKEVNSLSNNTLELTHERLDKVLDFIKDNNGGKWLEIGQNIIIYSDSNTIRFTKNVKVNTIDLNINCEGKYDLDDGRKIIVSHDYHMLPSKYSYKLCYNSLSEIFPLKIRTYKHGDKIKVGSITKSVSQILKDDKVLVEDRPNTLVMEVRGEIVFVVGHARTNTDLSKKNIIYVSVKNDEENV